MSKYEMALVISAKLDDETRVGVLEKAKGYIERSGGVIGKVQEWGKKRLAYEIQHQREGYYYFIPFEAETGSPAEIERHARIMDHVLRYLIVRQDNEFIVEPPADEPETFEEAPAPQASEPTEAPAEETAEAAEEVVGETTESVEEAAEESAEVAEEAAEAVEEAAEESAETIAEEPAEELAEVVEEAADTEAPAEE